MSGNKSATVAGGPKVGRFGSGSGMKYDSYNESNESLLFACIAPPSPASLDTNDVVP